MAKTVKIADLIDKINTMLRAKNTIFERQALILFINDILHENKVYAGFNYLEESEVPVGCTPGIKRSEPDWFKDTDNTRIFYYIHHTLRNKNPELSCRL